MRKYFIDSDDKVDEALAILDKENLLSGDTETNGLGVYTCKLWSVQLSTENDAFLFPWNALNEKSRDKLRKFLVNKTVIFHNAKFDYKFLWINGFDIGKTYCTQETERILFAGKYFTFGLKDILLRRFQIKMDKEVREIFYSEDPTQVSEFQKRVDEFGEWGAWNDALVDYAIGDVEYLHEIYYAQQEDAKQLGMSNIVWLENHVVPVTADMELRGVWLDNKAVKKFREKVSKRRDELSLEIFGALEKSYDISWQKEYTKRMELWNTWKISHEKIKLANSQRDPDDKRKKTEKAKAAVEASNRRKPFSAVPSPINKFSPTSPPKLQMALSQLTGLDITTTNKDWLEENVNLHPAIATLVEFRKFEKLCQFCELTTEINPVTGRIHAWFHPNGTKSGRFSCSDPNLQQIPARTDEAKEFRALFKPAEGKVFVGADLAGIELVILAVKSGETILIDAINRGDDVHCFTMSQFLTSSYATILKAKNKEELSDEEVSELESAKEAFEASFRMPELIKLFDIYEWIGKLRDYTKTITYGTVYGLSPYGLSIKFHCSFKDAEKFIFDVFFAVYPNLKKFLNVQETIGYERMYAVNPLGRRRWFRKPIKKSYEEVEKEVIKSLDQQKRLWDSVTDIEWEELMTKALKDSEKEYRGKMNSIKRQAGNFYPQSMCADMIKLAMIKFDKEFNKIKSVDSSQEGLWACIHDELQVECFIEHSEDAVRVITESMEYAVKKFLPVIKTKVVAKISDRWEK